MTQISPPARPSFERMAASESANRFDLLRAPLIGPFLCWRASRLMLQTAVFLLAMVMIAHAFFGPDLAPKNLAALLTWVHFRGLIVLVLLLAGNFFCMACPFTLPREWARKWISPRWNWPHKLRNKGPAIILFVGVLFVYEWIDLWSDPWATGWLIAGYFAGAFVIDVIFKRASFCKFVCPVGQFNFLGSTLSPLEVAVRNPEICGDCRTKDCITGTRERDSIGVSRITQRGCEMGLFQPRKVGNLDCTFCMDCVYACPHDNVGILARVPADELTLNGSRSSIGTLEKRSDWTVLSIVFVFGALLNAFAMVSPVYSLQQAIAHFTGLKWEAPILAVVFVFMLVIEPVVLLGGAAWLSRVLISTRDSLWTIINRFAKSLVPLGFGIWLAHYGFHFFTGALTIIPVTQNAVRAATGCDLLGAPLWQLGGFPEAVVYPMELGFLGLGLLGSLFIGWNTARECAPARPMRAFAPWGLVSLLLFSAACWVLSQPMDMRGTFVGG